MRPFTEGLFRGNAEALTEKGWKPNEQRRCFKKADALLDYITRIKPGEYYPMKGHIELNLQRIDGLKYCLEKDMPSKKMQGLSLEILQKLLSMGDELLKRAAWLYQNYPALFKAKYASSHQAFQKDAHFYFIKGHIVPEQSFPPFKTGENPVLSRDNTFLKRCLEMYMDPIFKDPKFLAHCQKRESKDPYVRWIYSKKAGRRFSTEIRALNHVINQLALQNAIELKTDKALANQLLREKQKTL